MHRYGWVVTAAIVAAVSFVGWYWYEWKWDLAIGIPLAVAVLMALPRMPDRLASNLVWLIPISMLVLQIYIVKDYFLKQPRRRSTWGAGTNRL
jgi:hypothetical protein